MFRLLIAVLYLTLAVPLTYGVLALDGRIVGGEPADIENYPYQASLQYATYHRCGAVVISRDYVLTVAHCTKGYSVSRLTVRAGATLRNTGGVVVQVATVYQHKNYDNVTYDYDISVLRLASSLPFGMLIGSVDLPELNQAVIPGSIGHVSGWGVITESGSTDQQLQVVEVPILSLLDCRQSYGFTRITDRMICAGLPEGGKDRCDGDSGGPLVVDGTLIGLASWGRGCARPNYPGVYASVPNLRQYIAEITGF